MASCSSRNFRLALDSVNVVGVGGVEVEVEVEVEFEVEFEVEVDGMEERYDERTDVGEVEEEGRGRRGRRGGGRGFSCDAIVVCTG